MHKQSLRAAQHWEHICCTALTRGITEACGAGVGGGGRPGTNGGRGEERGEGGVEKRVVVVEAEEKRQWLGLALGKDRKEGEASRADGAGKSEGGVERGGEMG